MNTRVHTKTITVLFRDFQYECTQILYFLLDIF